MTFHLRPQSEADLEDIALYIAEDNVQAARQWIEDMYALCQQLGQMPLMGIAKLYIRACISTGRPAMLGPWTTLKDNLMDGYAPVHEVSHRELPTGFPT
jgi:hypothetical protein